MRLSYVFLLLAGIPTAASAQANTEFMNQSTRDRINFSNLNIPNSGMLFGIKGEGGKHLGDAYLDTTWQAGNIKFYGRLNAATDSLAGVPVRLDLMANEVEIKAGTRDIRAAKAPTVRYMDLNNRFGTSSRFINVREYRGDADLLTGFFEQIELGKLDLLLHPTVYIRQANYNTAMNVGTKDDEIMKKMDWYIGQKGRATKLSAGKKSILALMSDKKEQIEVFLKRTDPDLKSRTGLMSVVAYYNSL